MGCQFIALDAISRSVSRTVGTNTTVRCGDLTTF